MASYDVTSLFTKIVYVSKETGFSVVMLHYPKFPDFKALNVQFMSVPLPKAFTVHRFSRVINLLLASLACLRSY